jgi:oxygen-dependent protoporphyrinogen oxidase
LLEPLLAGKAVNEDQTIYEFARSHIGKEAADYLVQPMVSGIFGGLADKLSLESCFPIMSKMEREHGSLVRAMIARKRQAKSQKRKSGSPAGPAGWLTSFKGGLDRLIMRLGDLYSDQIHTSAAATSIQLKDDECQITINHERTLTAKRVVLAIPSYRAAGLVSDLAPKLANRLSAIPYAPISVVSLGYLKSAVNHPLDGFGFLVPRVEKRRILGSIWTSSIFTERAPEAQVQFRNMIGGDGDHESAEFSDEKLVELVQSDLSQILGIAGPPTLTRVYRWKCGIPQYLIGHQRRMREIEAQLEKLGRIDIAGNAYYGIGINDCVKRSYAVAEKISDSLSS